MMIDIEKLIAQQNLLQKLEYLIDKDYSMAIDVLRLDKIHLIASGNKLFKLAIPLQKATDKNATTIITKGGIYSNHLIATAYMCNKKGLQSIGIIKAHHTIKLTSTLKDCENLGMKFVFMQPSDFNNPEKIQECISNYNNNFWIDMGGYSEEGAEGCKKILTITHHNPYTHIITAVGTGTTLAGLSLSASKHQKIIGISSMKNNTSLLLEINKLLQNKIYAPFEIIHDFHFNGFAKPSPLLITFMNDLYKKHTIPTDIVYTAKLFYAVNQLIKSKFFSTNHKLLIIHTGGLQGNRSLPKGTLLF